MDRLSIILTLMTGSVLTGVLTITVMSLGLYSWFYIGGSALIGFTLSWPAAYWISQWIKADDPKWDNKKNEPVDGEQRGSLPEV